MLDLVGCLESSAGDQVDWLRAATFPDRVAAIDNVIPVHVPHARPIYPRTPALAGVVRESLADFRCSMVEIAIRIKRDERQLPIQALDHEVRLCLRCRVDSPVLANHIVNLCELLPVCGAHLATLAEITFRHPKVKVLSGRSRGPHRVADSGR